MANSNRDEITQMEDDLLRSTDDEQQKPHLLNSNSDKSTHRKGNRRSKDTKQSTTRGNAIEKSDDAKHNQLLSLLADIKQQNKDTNHEIATIKNTFDSRFVAIDKELSSNKKNVSGIVNRIVKMESRIDEATHDKELTKQTALKNNVTMYGFPHSEGENIGLVASLIFKAFGCEFVESDFNAVYRSMGKSNKTIVVKFNDFNKKTFGARIES